MSKRLCLIAVVAIILGMGGAPQDGPTPRETGGIAPLPTSDIGPTALPSPIPFPVPPFGQCGENVCGFGEYCCNVSCSACAPIGAYCTQEVCNPTS